MGAERPTEDRPTKVVSFGRTTYDVSFITNPERSKLLQDAGRQVGLGVYEVGIVVDDTGRISPMKHGEIGVRYMTDDPSLIDRFNKVVAELTEAQQQTQ